MALALVGAVFMFAGSGGAAAASSPSPTGATITSNQADYPPGSNVTLTGAGWGIGESVQIHVNDDANQVWQYDGSAFAGLDGSFTHGFQLPNVFVANYSVTATGTTSGTATTTFTDANASANLDQCANGQSPCPRPMAAEFERHQWVNGNNGSKANYFEGDSLPYRMAFDNLSTLGLHHVTIEWDTTKGGKHALDYITTYNNTVTTANPCLGIASCNSASGNPFAIPMDPQVDNGSGSPISQAAGNLTLFGGTIATVSCGGPGGLGCAAGSPYYYKNGTGFSGDQSARITINFTASVVDPVLAWAGHIASHKDWGTGNAAANITGDPFHTRLIDLDGSGGNQDRALSSDAVTFPAEIHIIKHANVPSTTAFGFTASPTPLANFSLTDDSASTDPHQDYTLSDPANFKTYTVSEDDPLPTYALTGLACTDVGVDNSSTSLATRTATLKVDEGDVITCTFTNTQQNGTLIVKKVVVNDHGGTNTAGNFNFSVSGPTASSGTAFNETADNDSNALTGQNTLSVSQGTYTVTEDGTPIAGYSTTYSSDCTSVVVAAGQTKTCTVTNTDQAPSLTLNKIVVNDNGGSRAESEWTLTANGGTAGTLSGAGAAGSSDVVSGTGFKAGSYNLSESGPTDYTASSWSCSKNGGAYAAATSITLGLGDTGVCKITNDDQAPSLTLNKIVVNDNGGSRAESEWTLTANGGTAGTLSGAGAAGSSDVVSGTGFKAGSYNLSESGPTDYTASSWSCSKNGGAYAAATSITLGLGDTGVCKITNDDQAPSLTLNKIVVNDNGGSRAESEWTLTANGGTAGTLSGAGAAGSSDVVSGTGFKAGSYNLSESGPTDYTASSWSCSKNGGAYAAATSITLGLGDTGVCKITNDDQRTEPDPEQDRRERQRRQQGGVGVDADRQRRHRGHAVWCRCSRQQRRRQRHRL